MDKQIFGSAGESPLLSLYNTEVEQALLGAILLNNNAFEHVVDIIGPEDFSNGIHGQIYATIGKLVSDGIPANAVTVRKMVDGPSPNYLAQLINSAVTVVNAPYYAQMIADLARRRDIVTAAQDTIADAVVIDPERPADTVLDEAEERLFSIADRSDKKHSLSPLGEILVETVANIQAAYKAGGAVTVDTGLADLDHILSGMGAGDLVVLAARPSMGKSALAGTVATNVARQGKRVLIFSLEMTRAEWAGRWIAGITGISTDRQRHGKLDQHDWNRLVDAQAFLSKLPISVDDGSRLSVAMMLYRARRLKRRLKSLDFVIVDHLQQIRQGGKQESRRLEIGDATSMFKALAKELKVPVLLLSQLSREPEKRNDKRPMLADLRESGDIEQDADVVMFLYRDEYYLERSEPKAALSGASFAADHADWEEAIARARGVAEIAVAKNRHGRTGAVMVHFDAERQRFESLARGQ